jgi:isopenicillin N synthase-like dioxygenase
VLGFIFINWRDKFMVKVPVIDFSPFTQGNGQEQQAVVNQISRACEEIGFFYLKNHGVSPELLGKLLHQSRRFFDLPTEVKHKLARSTQTNCGYVGFQTERLNPQNPGDLKEAFNVGLGNLEPPLDTLPELAEFQQIVRQFYQLTTQVIAPQILRAFALGLKLPLNFFDDHHGENYFLRLLHYPPITQPPSPDQLRAGAHSDYGSITLLWQDEIGGLEVLTPQGEWLAVPYQADTVVVNVGDAMQHWTNNCRRSTKHRVIIPPETKKGISRYSIALFCDPNPEVELACLETCCSPDHPPSYQPQLMRDFLAQRLNATY